MSNSGSSAPKGLPLSALTSQTSVPLPSRSTKNVFTPILQAAVSEGNLPLVKKLMEGKKIPLRTPDAVTGWPLLFYAIRYGHNSVVEFLLNEGHDEREISRDFKGNTALTIATAYNNEAAFRAYLARYPQIALVANKDGASPLLIAAQKGLDTIITTLLELGADINTTDLEGSTPLHHAAAWGFFETVTLLMQRGASYTIKNKRGWTPLDYVYSVDVWDHLQECAHALSEKRAIRPVVMQRAMTSASIAANSYPSHHASVNSGSGGASGLAAIVSRYA